MSAEKLAPALLMALSFTLSLASCARARPDLAVVYGCAAIDQAQDILAREKGGAIVLDGSSPEAAAAASALSCLAAANGDRVAVGAPADVAALLTADIGALAARGATVGLFSLSASAAPDMPARITQEERERAAGEARNAALAQAVAAHIRAGPIDRMILIVAPPDAARAPVGLSSHTWRPLGARLPVDKTLSLRVEASARPGMRVRLMTFEDVPARGAALRYDGLIEVGPVTQ